MRNKKVEEYTWWRRKCEWKSEAAARPQGLINKNPDKRCKKNGRLVGDHREK